MGWQCRKCESMNHDDHFECLVCMVDDRENTIERLRAALERIATKPPVNEEYGNQGYDADEMQAMADAALQEGE